MSLLASAVGATLAAILESSVLTQLAAGAVKPDLLFALTIAAAMVLGFQDAMVWAFVGGVMLDTLSPERPLGATALAFLICVGLALLVARATEPGRLGVIAVSAFSLTFLYQALLLILLAMTAGVRITQVQISTLGLIAAMNAAIAVAAAWVMRALVTRFGRAERPDW
jgi:rod shape-determining protein MreD